MRAIIMVFLVFLPVALIGFCGGVLDARNVYLPQFKWQRKLIGRLQRRLGITPDWWGEG